MGGLGMTVRTQTALQTQIDTLLADNTSGDINGADIQSVCTDLNDTIADLKGKSADTAIQSNIDNNLNDNVIGAVSATDYADVATGLNGFIFSASALATSLVSWWTLDETGGTRFDAHGSNNLTDNNTVTQATGRVSNAGQFTRSNIEYLNTTSPSGLNGGGRDYTIAAWVYADSLADNQVIVNMRTGNNPSDNDYYISLETDLSPDLFTFWIGTAVNSWQKVTATTFGAPSISTWYLVIVSYDSSSKTQSISVNAGTEDARVIDGTPYSSSSEFRIGKYHSSSGFEWDGRIDEVAFWSRLLTADERTELYNSGVGIGYPG